MKKIISKFTSKEFIKFFVVGLVNTFNHNIIYLFLLTYINYMYSTLIAFIIAMCISFFLNCYITFNVKPTWKKLLLFPISNIPNFFFQIVGIYIVVGILKIPEQYGSIICTLLALPFTYLIMKVILKKPIKKTNNC